MSIPQVKILTSYIALLCLGKSDFEAIEAFRQDPYFAETLDIDQVPSAVTLRQRLDTHAAAFIAPIIEASIAFLQRIAAPITPLANGLVALDADVTPLNNAKTALIINRAKTQPKAWLIAYGGSGRTREIAYPWKCKPTEGNGT